MPQLVGQAFVGGDRLVHRGDVAELEQVGDAEMVAAQQQLAVVVRLRQAHDLRPQRQALGGIGQPPQTEMARLEGGGQRRRVIDAPRHRHRLLAQLGAVRNVGIEVQLRGQAGQHDGALRSVACVEARQALLEQRDQRLVDPADADHDAAEPQRRGGEGVGIAELARDGGGALEAVPGPLHVAGARERVAEREEQAAAARLVRRRQRQAAQGEIEVLGRLFVGQAAERILGGADGIVDRRLDAVAAERGLEEVVRELVVVRFGPGRVDVDQDLGDAPVQARAPDGAQLLVQRLAHQRVGEEVAAAGTGHLGDHAGVDRLVERVERALGRAVADPYQRRERELAPECRRQDEHAVALFRESVETAGDHRPHALRDGVLRHAARLRRRRACVVGQQAHQLGDEEWIALAAGEDRLGEPGRGFAPGVQLDEAGHVGCGQTAEHDALAGRFARQFGQGRQQRMCRAHFGVAVGADDQQARVG